MDIKLLVLTVLIALASGRPHRKLCPVSRYLSGLSSADMAILKRLQHHHEKAISINAMSCYGRMLRHKPSACDLTASDSLMLTLEQVSLAVEVLSDMSTYAVSDPVTQALMLFLKMKDDLMTCRESEEYSEPASPELKNWLHHLKHFQEVKTQLLCASLKDPDMVMVTGYGKTTTRMQSHGASPECVQDAVMLNLIPLREDVKCWALSQ